MTSILIACGVVSTVALVAGVLLGLVNRFFGVEEDPKVKAIRTCLPSANCGACGCKGCDDYAAAVAEGKVKPNLCVPGGESVSAMIGDILGVEVEAPENLVAFVHCNGNCEATEKSFEYVGIKTCSAASSLFGGPESCKYGCIGFGDCAAVCPENCICMMDGIAHVDTTRCLGCGLCRTVCPKHVISLVPQKTIAAVMCNSKDKGAVARKNCSNACIGCKKCEKTCPQNAIKVTDNLAEIDYDKCTGCGACSEACPTGCLKNVSF